MITSQHDAIALIKLVLYQKILIHQRTEKWREFQLNSRKLNAPHLGNYDFSNFPTRPISSDRNRKIPWTPACAGEFHTARSFSQSVQQNTLCVSRIRAQHSVCWLASALMSSRRARAHSCHGDHYVYTLSTYMHVRVCSFPYGTSLGEYSKTGLRAAVVGEGTCGGDGIFSFLKIHEST